MRKYNLSEIMKKAWEVFRAGKYDGDFGECLRYAWFCAKLEVSRRVRHGYTIKDWFWNKVVEERCSGDWVINTTFEVKDIIKETEKAFFVEMKVGNLVTGKDSKWTKNVWIPKSACF